MKQKQLLLYVVLLGFYLIFIGIAMFKYNSQLARTINSVVLGAHIIYLLIYAIIHKKKSE